MSLDERHHRTGVLVAAPDPLAPTHQHLPVTPRSVVQLLNPPVVQPGHHPAAVATADVYVGLNQQPQADLVGLGRKDTHPSHTEHHRCRRAALTTVHSVEALRTGCLVAPDP
jgi:hypothetical protein